MKLVILGLLLLQPMSLYDLHKSFQAGVSLFYSASFGALQRALTQLVAEGLVVAVPQPGDPRGKKLHSITDAGRAAWHDGMLAPLPASGVETAILARVFFLGLLDDADRAAVTALCRERVASDLAELRAAAVELDALDIPPEFVAAFRYQRATLDYGVRSNEVAAEWLEGLPG